MIKGLIFDFDGLILDTEFPLFQAWQEIYHQNGCDLPLTDWAIGLGTAANAFDPLDFLEKRAGISVDRQVLLETQRVKSNQLIDREELLPGVFDYIQSAKRMGLKLSVASSSPRAWVTGHLARFGLIPEFDIIRCEEDVSRVKPDPALFLSALDGMGLDPKEAVVFEDSPNGITAAKAAGIYCVAVPNRLSKYLPVQHAERIIPSMASIQLAELLADIENSTNNPKAFWNGDQRRPGCQSMP